jgi:hypothetical protein
MEGVAEGIVGEYEEFPEGKTKSEFGKDHSLFIVDNDLRS